MAEVSLHSTGHSRVKNKSENSSAPGLFPGSASDIEFHSASNTHVITYRGEFKADFFLKKHASALVGTFGEKRIAAFGEFFSYLFPPLFVMFSFLLSGFLSSDFGVPLWVDSFIIGFGVAAGVLGLLLGGQFLRVADRHRDSLCRGCGEPFACEEFEKPDVKELSTPYSYSVKVTRYWRCKSCGYEDARTGDEGIAARKGDEGGASFLKNVRCKGCGEKASCEEFKRPDVKEIKRLLWFEVFITRYWKCKNCGHEDIRVDRQRI